MMPSGLAGFLFLWNSCGLPLWVGAEASPVETVDYPDIVNMFEVKMSSTTRQ